MKSFQIKLLTVICSIGIYAIGITCCSTPGSQSSDNQDSSNPDFSDNFTDSSFVDTLNVFQDEEVIADDEVIFEEENTPFIEWEYNGNNDEAFNSPSQTRTHDMAKHMKGDASDTGRLISCCDYTYTGHWKINGQWQPKSSPFITEYTFYEKWAFDKYEVPYNFVGMVTFEGERCRRYNGISGHYMLLKPDGSMVSRSYQEYDDPLFGHVKKESFSYYVWGNRIDEYSGQTNPVTSPQTMNSSANMNSQSSSSTINSRTRCSTCGGTGNCSNPSSPYNSRTYCHGSGLCPLCGGDGWVDNSYTSKPQRCSSCNGNGRCQTCLGTGQCKRCGGSGWL